MKIGRLMAAVLTAAVGTSLLAVPAQAAQATQAARVHCAPVHTHEDGPYDDDLPPCAIKDRTTSTTMKIALAGFTGSIGSPVTGRFLLEGSDETKVTFTVTDPGALPPGITMGTDGTLKGVPEQAGSFTFPVRICMGTACGNTTLTLVISAEGTTGATTMTKVTASVNVPKGFPADLQLPGKPGADFTVTNPDAVPPGLKIEADGHITGTATELGVYEVKLETEGEVWNVSIEVCDCEVEVSYK